MKNRRLMRVGLSVLVVGLAACANEGPSATAEVELAEFWVTPDHHVLSAGTVELMVENYGEFPHTMVVSDSSGVVLAATELISPDAETTLTIDLLPGKYALTCRIVKGLEDGTVLDHYQEGMEATVEVVG